MKTLICIILFSLSASAFAQWSIVSDHKYKVWKSSDYPTLYLTEADYFNNKNSMKSDTLSLFNITNWKIKKEKLSYISGTYIDKNGLINYFFESKTKKSIHIVTTNKGLSTKLWQIYLEFLRAQKK